MDKYKQGEFFSPELLAQIRSRLDYVDYDPYAGKRIYFENAGGSLRLKKVSEFIAKETAFPDSPNRPSKASAHLKEMMVKGVEDTRLFLGAKDSGIVFSSQTASRVLYHMTQAIIFGVEGSNVVTTDLEHPASYDSAKYYAGIAGKELRVAKTYPQTGTVKPEEILKHIDKDTCLLSFIYASNITGVLCDAKTIIEEARKIKPDLYILLDLTQHVPHGPTDVLELGVDAVGFTPYKMLGKRGQGIGWVSDRCARLPHERTLERDITDWEVGSAEPAAWGCWSVVVDYLDWLGESLGAGADRRERILTAMEGIALHERAILHRMLNGSDKAKGLKNIKGAKTHFIGEDLTNRDCILPITFANKSGSEAVKEYIDKGIVVFDRAVTNILSGRQLKALGLDSLVRISPMHFNTADEVDEFLKATMEIANG
ncbi:MAG: aminotransferase class V-fold PLP-dependent enzyme [Defluviitaleaceae bacterium]|nr:aminotransferase class V-fold PLP-dependent enzyme [Defluviitaleaceae bacterium]